MASSSAARAIHCDGCAREALPEHLRRRVARLELASRFRPIRIATLLLSPEPAPALEDYFYATEALPRQAEARAFFEDVMAACGVPDAAANKAAGLARFQHAGLFLADAVECPAEEEARGNFEELLSQLTPTILRRVRNSYRPKAVLVLSERLAGLARALSEAGIDAELLLWEGAPVSLPRAQDAAGRERFRNQLRTLLARSA